MSNDPSLQTDAAICWRYVDKLSIGDRVRYIPGHAKGDANHPDCEDGIIRSFNRHGHPFVVYDNQVRGVLDTLGKAEKWTAACTNPEDLVMLDE